MFNIDFSKVGTDEIKPTDAMKALAKKMAEASMQPQRQAPNQMAQDQKDLLSTMLAKLQQPVKTENRPTFMDLPAALFNPKGNLLSNIADTLGKAYNYSQTSEAYRLGGMLNSNPYWGNKSLEKADLLKQQEMERDAAIQKMQDDRDSDLMKYLVGQQSAEQTGNLEAYKKESDLLKAISEKEAEGKNSLALQDLKNTGDYNVEDRRAKGTLDVEKVKGKNSVDVAEIKARGQKPVVVGTRGTGGTQPPGAPKLPAAAKSMQIDLISTGKDLQNFYGLAKNLNGKKMIRFAPDVLSQGKQATGFLSPEEQSFVSSRAGLMSNVSKNLGGEKGVLTDKDIIRVDALLPSFKTPSRNWLAQMREAEKFLNNKIIAYNEVYGTKLPLYNFTGLAFPKSNQKSSQNQQKSTSTPKNAIRYAKNPKTGRMEQVND